QQNTLRDALVAAITLDTFNRHADKLVMANIAQAVNVLQALSLTQGEKLVLTPTYHVFDFYQSHQGGRSLRTVVESPEVSFAAGNVREKIPTLAGSASVKGNALTLSVTNADARLPAEVTIDLRGRAAQDVSISVLADEDIHAHNTFEEPQRLLPQPETRSDALQTSTFPPASVLVI